MATGAAVTLRVDGGTDGVGGGQGGGYGGAAACGAQGGKEGIQRGPLGTLPMTHCGWVLSFRDTPVCAQLSGILRLCRVPTAPRGAWRWGVLSRQGA